MMVPFAQIADVVSVKQYSKENPFSEQIDVLK
jgi:hypothetical protein